MRKAAGILVVVLACTLAGCDSHSNVLPTAPSSTSPPGPATRTIAGERWNLTTTLKSATGPEGCVVDTSDIWEFGNSLMTIERSGESIHVVLNVDDPTNLIEYEGTVVADVLTVPIKSSHGGFTSAGWCGRRAGAGKVEILRMEQYVSGRFSGDGHALTAEEVTTMQLKSGDPHFPH